MGQISIFYLILFVFTFAQAKVDHFVYFNKTVWIANTPPLPANTTGHSNVTFNSRKISGPQATIVNAQVRNKNIASSEAKCIPSSIESYNVCILHKVIYKGQQHYVRGFFPDKSIVLKNSSARSRTFVRVPMNSNDLSFLSDQPSLDYKYKYYVFDNRGNESAAIPHNHPGFFYSVRGSDEVWLNNSGSLVFKYYRSLGETVTATLPGGRRQLARADSSECFPIDGNCLNVGDNVTLVLNGDSFKFPILAFFVEEDAFVIRNPRPIDQNGANYLKVMFESNSILSAVSSTSRVERCRSSEQYAVDPDSLDESTSSCY